MRRVTYLQNPTDDIVRLMIYKSDVGVYVFGFDDLADSASKWDNLFQDLEEALGFCQDTYNVDNDKWISIEDPHTTCHTTGLKESELKGSKKETLVGTI